MLSLKEFKEYLTFIKEQRSKEDTFIKALEILSSDSSCDCFLYSSYEEKIISLLENIFNDKNCDISFFIYDLNGLDNKSFIIKDKSKCPTDMEGNICYYSADTLYEYLTKYNV